MESGHFLVLFRPILLNWYEEDKVADTDAGAESDLDLPDLYIRKVAKTVSLLPREHQVLPLKTSNRQRSTDMLLLASLLD